MQQDAVAGAAFLKWHDIPKHRELSDEEVEYIVRVLLEWIAKNLQKNLAKEGSKRRDSAASLASPFSKT